MRGKQLGLSRDRELAASLHGKLPGRCQCWSPTWQPALLIDASKPLNQIGFVRREHLTLGVFDPRVAGRKVQRYLLAPAIERKI